MGRLFKLKKGSHSQGGRVWKSSDPLNNIIESDEPLSRNEPQRWEEFAGDHDDLPDGYDPKPPSKAASSDVTLDLAPILATGRELSLEEKREKARKLRELADAILDGSGPEKTGSEPAPKPEAPTTTDSTSGKEIGEGAKGGPHTHVQSGPKPAQEPKKR